VELVWRGAGEELAADTLGVGVDAEGMGINWWADNVE
jgi:hypothetical protein